MVEVDVQWESKYQELIAFKKSNGHVEVARRLDSSLSLWLRRQKQKYRENRLDPGRSKRLEELGVELKVNASQEASWMRYYRQLCTFQRKNGHLSVPWRHGHDYNLCRWMRRQQENHHRGRLKCRWFLKLSEIGFEWRDVNTDGSCTRPLKETKSKDIVQAVRSSTEMLQKDNDEDGVLPSFQPSAVNLKLQTPVTSVRTHTVVYTRDLHDVIEGLAANSMSVQQAVERLRDMTHINKDAYPY